MNSMSQLFSEKQKRMLLIAICIALAAQVNFSYAIDGFMVTFAVILLPIFLALNDDINPFAICSRVSIASPLFRGWILAISQTADFHIIARYILTDVSFYLCYGATYYLIYWQRKQRNTVWFFCTILLSDYLANLFEISLLVHFTNYTPHIFNFIFSTALVRSLIGSACVYGYRYLSLLLRKESHEQRYQYFMWLSSAVKTDVYFMEKILMKLKIS